MTATTQEPHGAPRGLTALRFGLMLVGVAALFAAHLFLGSTWISPAQVWDAIRQVGEPQTTDIIVWDLRIMRAVTAMVSGAALAVSGLQMQTLFRNPLAGPYVLGITSGASLGVAIVLLSGWVGLLGAIEAPALAALVRTAQSLSVVGGAILGAGLVMAVVLLAARRVASSMTLLILGLLIGYAVNAVVSLLFHFSSAAQAQRYVAWGFGSFADVSAADAVILGPVIGVALLGSLVLVKPMNAMLLGDNYAASLGLDVRRMRLALVALSAVLAAVVVAYCGPIGFIGVAVPHLVRGWLRSSDHQHVLPACILVGAIVAMAADLVAKLPGMVGVLPLNAVTALIGAPVVAWVVLRNRQLRDSFR